MTPIYFFLQGQLPNFWWQLTHGPAEILGRGTWAAAVHTYYDAVPCPNVVGQAWPLF
jgi:hypothetical protein